MGIIKRNDILYSGTANSATKINFIDTIAQLGAGTVQTAIEKLKALIGTVPSGKTIEGQISELNEKIITKISYEYLTMSPNRTIEDSIDISNLLDDNYWISNIIFISSNNNCYAKNIYYGNGRAYGTFVNNSSSDQGFVTFTCVITMIKK